MSYLMAIGEAGARVVMAYPVQVTVVLALANVANSFDIWKMAKKTWRAVGFDKDGYFVMVIGCSHKDGVYDPRNWLQTAKQRKKETIEEKWRIIDYAHA